MFDRIDPYRRGPVYSGAGDLKWPPSANKRGIRGA